MSAAIASGWPVSAQVVAVLWLSFVCAAVSSFLGVVGYRVPRGLSINGRSHCACGRQLNWIDLLPVVGWLRLGITNRGRASCCGAKVPARYFVTELVAGGVGAGGIFVFGSWVVWGMSILLVLVAVLFVDVKFSHDDPGIAGMDVLPVGDGQGDKGCT